jgi:hypothetical protein
VAELEEARVARSCRVAALMAVFPLIMVIVSGMSVKCSRNPSNFSDEQTCSGCFRVQADCRNQRVQVLRSYNTP